MSGLPGDSPPIQAQQFQNLQAMLKERDTTIANLQAQLTVLEGVVATQAPELHYWRETLGARHGSPVEMVVRLSLALTPEQQDKVSQELLDRCAEWGTEELRQLSIKPEALRNAEKKAAEQRDRAAKAEAKLKKWQDYADTLLKSVSDARHATHDGVYLDRPER